MKNKYIVLDFETTGLYAEIDEVLQVAIANEKREVLLNELCKPAKKKSWSEAQRIHGITKEMVYDKRCFSEYVKTIEAILSNSEYVVCYNIAFEKKFLTKYGIDTKKYKFVDAMLIFSKKYNQ